MIINRDIRERKGINQPLQSLKNNQQLQKLGQFFENKRRIKFDFSYFLFYPTYKALPIKPIAFRRPLAVLQEELNSLGSNCLLFTLKEFSIYCAPGHQIPNLLHEIARLREITFRQVGEGTNNEIDLDEYDQYYQQLFIWDNNEGTIVGGYRVGLGRDIMYIKGRKGFYLHTLFNMNAQTDELLEQSMEMGRSFIVTEYQRKPLSLFLLWKGIFIYLLTNPHYRYLIGPVSISSNFSPIAQQVMVEYIEKHHLHSTYSKHINPCKTFQKSLPKSKTKTILESITSFQELENFILKMENCPIPVLLKKYIQLGAKIACFNVDPLFNNSLDGFLILDLETVPQDMIITLSKEIDKEKVTRRFKDKGLS